MVLVTNSYGTSNIDLRWEFANVINKMCTYKLAVKKEKAKTSLEAFLAWRLIPLNKNPGLRPGVLRRTGEKVLMKIAKEDITKEVGFFKLCAVQEAGNEAAIQVMHSIFEANEEEP